MIFLAWITLLTKVPKWYRFDPWAPQLDDTFLLSLHAQIAGLFFLLGFRIRRLVGAKRQSLFTKFAFDSVTGQREPMDWYSVLFGTSVFRSRYVWVIHRFLTSALIIHGILDYSGMSHILSEDSALSSRTRSSVDSSYTLFSNWL